MSEEMKQGFEEFELEAEEEMTADTLEELSNNKGEED